MKILCVIDSLRSGGAQRQLVNLAIAFQKKGHQVEFLVYHSDSFYYEILLEKKIKIIEVLENNYIKRIFKMRKMIRNGNYDTVLSFLEAASFISTLSGFPYRKWNLVVGERSANPNILKSFKLKMYRWFHLFATAIVSNSHDNLKIVKKINPLLSTNKLYVIYNLIDFEKWQPCNHNYVYRENGKFNLTVVASHQYLKNLNGLVEAVNFLDEYEKNQLVINWYGDVLDSSKFEAIEKIKKYHLEDIFNFHDATKEISSKVNAADAVGLFSFYEGLPNAICEAMVNAKPIISSNVSDINLFLSNDYIFSPDQSTDIAKKIKFLLSLDQSALIQAGQINRNLASTIFSEDEIVKQYLSIMS